MTKTVYIVGGDHSVEEMFVEAGWNSHGVAPESDLPDLVCFTGGADVSPYLYGEENTHSSCDPLRDESEKQVYEEFVNRIPMVGICRGGQFLNVMNGGKMIQDHGLVTGYVEVCGYTKFPKTEVLGEVHVDHHQGILCKDGAELMWRGWNEYNHPYVTYDEWPVYTAWYHETRSLCFQPHPEWGHERTKDLFFDLIERYIG